MKPYQPAPSNEQVMKILPANNLVCPIDGTDLYRRDQCLVCPRGHNFDIARQGYINLLAVQHKASADPGDSKEMVAARRRFLETGCYEAIANSIANLTQKHLSADLPVTILDAGCGEGYYLSWLLSSMAFSNPVIAIGMDISKWAIQSAAKRDRQITWIVGSNARSPFQHDSINLILCAFGFPSFDEFRRILKPQGKIIMVDPAPNHLIELRQLIYPIIIPSVKSKVSPIQDFQKQGFREIENSSLTYKSEVQSSQAVQDLFLMTPHYFRSPPEAKARISALSGLEFTVDISLRVLVKTMGQSYNTLQAANSNSK